MAQDTTKQTEEVMAHHLQALIRGQLDEVLSDYTADSILFGGQGPLHGLGEIRAFFDTQLKNTPPELVAAFKLIRQDVVGEVAYILWKAEPFILFGTDTFVVHDGKIKVQTFASYSPG